MDVVTLGAAKADASAKYSRSLRNSFCLVGDSFGALNHVIAGSVGVNGYTDYYNALQGFMPWAQARLHGRLVDLGNFAFTGLRSDQWISTGQITSVLAKRPAWCIVCAPTNDRAQGVSLATTQGYMTTIFDTLRAAGVRVLALGLTPTTGASAMSAAQLAYTAAYNFWIKQQQSTRVGFIAVDPFWSLTDGGTTGAWRAATVQWTTDGLHPQDWACAYMGKLIADALDPEVPYVDWRPVSGFDNNNGNSQAQAMSNPLTRGTGGSIGATGTGSVASSWSITSSGGGNFAGTVTASKVASTDLHAGEWQQIAVTGTASSVRFQQTSITTGYVAGTTTFQGFCEIDTDADITNYARLTLAAQAAVSGGAVEARWIAQPTSAAGVPTGARLTVDAKGRYPLLQTPVMTIPSTATSLACYVDFTGLGTIRLRNVGVRLNPPA